MDTRLDRVTLKVGADSVSGTLLAPDPRIPGVLFVHGWGATQQQHLAGVLPGAVNGPVSHPIGRRDRHRAAIGSGIECQHDHLVTCTVRPNSPA